MKNDPVITVLALASIALQALLVLAIALYAFVMALVPQPKPQPKPWVHPLAMVAEEAHQLTCRQLREVMPGKAPSKARKADLVAQLVAC